MSIPSMRALASGIAIVAALAACSKHEETRARRLGASTRPAATAAAPKATNAHAFNIGELSAFALRDGSLEFPNDNKIFALGRTAEEVGRVLTRQRPAHRHARVSPSSRCW